MFIKTFNITLGILVAFSVWCYALAFAYVVIRSVLLAFQIVP